MIIGRRRPGRSGSPCKGSARPTMKLRLSSVASRSPAPRLVDRTEHRETQARPRPAAWRSREKLSGRALSMATPPRDCLWMSSPAGCRLAAELDPFGSMESPALNELAAGGRA